MAMRPNLLEEVLRYLCERPDEWIPPVGLFEELDASSREPVIEILKITESLGYAETRASEYRITNDGRRMFRIFEGREVIPGDQETEEKPAEFPSEVDAAASALEAEETKVELLSKGAEEVLKLPWNLEALGLHPKYVRTINRQDIIEQIEGILEGRNDRRVVFLYGQPQVGKTFVLQRLEERLKDRYVPVLIHLNGWASVRKLSTFLYELAMSIQFEVESSYPELEIMPFQPGSDEQAPEEFQKFMSSLYQNIRAQGKLLLLMFDELEYLAWEETDRQIFEHMTDFVDEWSKEMRVIFCSRAPLDWLKRDNMKELEELVSRGQTVLIDCFESEVSQELVRALGTHLALDDGAVDAIVRLVDGHPSILRKALVILSHHWKDKWRSKEIKEDSLEAVFEDILIELSPTTRDIWYTLSPPEKRILQRVAQYNRDGFDIADSVFESSATEHLQQLGERRILHLDPEHKRYTVRLGILTESILYGILSASERQGNER